MLINGFLSFSGAELISTLLMLPGLVLGLTIHEYSHAKMSDKLGDPTPERQNRLTLNPLAHMDVMGTICLLFAGFGWGKPVSIDPTYYRNPAKDSMKVALAGPVSNFILAFLLMIITGILTLVPLGEKTGFILFSMFLSAVQINLCLGVFNLLPFPPLDGSKILGYFLRGKAKEILWTLERYSWVVLIILFATELPSKIIGPVVEFLFYGMIRLIGLIF
jgi:Zn-dependent protease